MRTLHHSSLTCLAVALAKADPSALLSDVAGQTFGKDVIVEF
jgi:hypothetical protein